MLSEVQKIAVRHLTPPADDRQMSDSELATALGVSHTTLGRWQKQPEFAAALEESRKSYTSDPNYFDRIARHHALEALLQGALMKANTRDELAHKRSCMKELLDQTKHLADEGQHLDLSRHTDAELLQMALTGDLDVTGYSKAELESALKEAS